MATTTTNYGFDVPTSSDLVKNGATQIALLGQDIDTFLFRPFTKNAVINGAFDIWQRGTSIAIGTFYPYTADRWQGVRGGVVTGMTVSRQTSGLTGIQYCARIQRDSGNTSTQTLQLFNAFESANSYQFAGQVVTFSFYARAGANYSGGVLSGYVGTGTGTDQNPITSAYTGGASSIIVSATLNGSTWTRYQGTATLPAGTTEMYTQFTYTPTGTAGANDYVEVTGVQVEVGSQVSPFTRAGGTIQGELAACQRYYTRLNTANITGVQIGYGFGATTSVGTFCVPLPVTLRSRSSITLDYANLRVMDYNNGYTGISTVGVYQGATDNLIWINTNMSSAVLTQYRPLFIDTLANGYLGISVEL
jgi:hypothetical protein